MTKSHAQSGPGGWQPVPVQVVVMPHVLEAERPAQDGTAPVTIKRSAATKPLAIADLAGRTTISVEEWAQLMGCGRNTAYRMAKERQLPGLLVLGNTYRVSVPATLKYLGAEQVNGQRNVEGLGTNGEQPLGVTDEPVEGARPAAW